MNRLSAILPGIVLVGLSLLMFAYVGYGEATRVYTDMRVQRLIQLGATLQHSLNKFAQSGLLLDQFSGFDRRAKQLSEVDSAIHTVALTDARGETIICLAAHEADASDDCEGRLKADADAFHGHHRLSNGDVAETDSGRILRLPVEDKFGVAGHVLLHVDEATMRRDVEASFVPVFIAAGALFVLFAVFQAALAGRSTEAARRWLTPTFLTVMVAIVAVLIVVMFELYRKGTEGQAEGLARSMASRLGAVTEIGIPIEALSGIEDALADYRRINPQIAAITLMREDDVLIRLADEHQATVHSDDGTLSFSQPIDPNERLVLTAELPLRVVIEAMGSGGRNFIALFFGCMLFSAIFFRAVRARAHAAPATGPGAKTGPKGEAGLAVLQPAYFLGILADSLVLSVLPELSQDLVAAEGLSNGLVSLPFSLFFIGLTVALIPASFMTERFDLRSLFMGGAAAVSAGLLLVGLVDSFWALCVGRALGGMGQGLLLITMQAYAFEMVSSENRVKAAAAQVLGYNGGLIVGTGIGGLIAVFMHDTDFIALAGLVAALAVVYTRFALPSLVKDHDPQPVRLFADLRRVLVFPDFLALLTLIGVTSKFALAGVAIFAMPLVLHRSGYGDDEIGQALMVFAVVTYLVTAVAPRLVSMLGSTDRALVVGMVALGLGMAGLGLVTGLGDGATAAALVPVWLSGLAGGVQETLAAIPLPVATGAAIALSVALLGVGQGLIAAPIIARVAAGGAAGAVGRDRTIAVYRILERIGHISGPALVGLLLVAASDNAAALAGLGMVYAALAVLYGLASFAMRERAPAGG